MNATSVSEVKSIWFATAKDYIAQFHGADALEQIVRSYDASSLEIVIV